MGLFKGRDDYGVKTQKLREMAFISANSFITTNLRGFLQEHTKEWMEQNGIEGEWEKYVLNNHEIEEFNSFFEKSPFYDDLMFLTEELKIVYERRIYDKVAADLFTPKFKEAACSILESYLKGAEDHFGANPDQYTTLVNDKEILCQTLLSLLRSNLLDGYLGSLKD